MKSLVATLAALVFSGVAAAAVNLNTATRDELVALPGIGPSKAQAIVDYRSQHGPFKTVDELRKVRGIGERLFLQLKPEISVGSTPRAPVTQAGKGEPRAEPKAEARADAKSGTRGSTGAIAKDDRARP